MLITLNQLKTGFQSIKNYIDDKISGVNDNIDAVTVTIDSTLTQSGQAAEAESTGNAIAEKAGFLVDTVNNGVATIVPDATIDNLQDVVVSIDPVQSGSGDPSPENVRPISGWNAVNVYRTGVNIWDEQWERTDIDWSTYIFTPSSTGGRLTSKNYISVVPGAEYYVRKPSTASIVRVGYTDSDGNGGRLLTSQNNVIIIPNDVHYIKFGVTTASYGTTYNNDISINYPSTDKSYRAGSVQTVAIDWTSEAGTVYGGSIDVTTGVLTITKANIESYNGETLPGAWISSMDVYTEGGTPTTGAQVVYELAEPVTVQLDQVTISALTGINNVWADSGDVSVTYVADLQNYIYRASIDSIDISETYTDSTVATNLATAKSYTNTKVASGVTEAKNYTDIAVSNAAVTIDDTLTQTGQAADAKATGDEISDLKENIGFVTPEMYGAVGDGTTDDSTAIQNAVNASNNIHFTVGKTYYLASQVEITNDMELHGNGATIKTVTPSGGVVNNGFYVHGTLKKTTTLTTDYETYNDTANSSNRITLVDMTGINIGDLLVIKATDQYYAYTRQYYYLGAVLEVVDIYNGCLYVNMSIPWDISLTENVTVEVYDAPSVSFENMNFISDHGSWGSYNSLINFEFCKNASVKDCNLTQFVMGIYFRRCINSIVENVRLSKSKYDNTEITNDGYGIAISSCTNTVVRRIISLCAQSCIDLTGDTPNINTYIYESNIASECRATGIGSHENAYNTVIEDCILGGLSAYGTVFINRCKFFKNNRGPTSNAGINYRGSHNADWSRLFVSSCEFDGNMAINILAPDAQDPVQAINSVIGCIDIKDCDGGFLSYIPSTGTNVTSNTINILKIVNWQNCNEIYHLGTNAINRLIIKDCTFGKSLFLNNHVNADGIVTTGIDIVDVSITAPLLHKTIIDKTIYGEKQSLPENVIINFTANAETDQFLICGSNLVSNDVQDYAVGNVSGSTGQTLSRSIVTGANIPTISVDTNGDIVYSQNSNTDKRYLYNKFMFSVDEASNISVAVTLKSADESASSWTIYAHRVDKDTGLVGGRTHSSSYAATTEGTSAILNYNGVSNSVVLISFYCDTPVENAVTTFEDMSITVTPLFNTAPSITETFTAKRLIGSGSLTSINGINNIMTSADTFHVKFGIDYNTLFPNPSAWGVGF